MPTIALLAPARVPACSVFMAVESGDDSKWCMYCDHVAAQMEFAVQMTCTACADDVYAKLNPIAGEAHLQPNQC